MSRLLSHIVLYTGVFIFSIPCVGQVNQEAKLFRDSLFRHISHEMSAELSCRFTYAQGSSVISASLGSNAAELDRLDNFIRQALNHPTLFISHICLTGYSSIEGSFAHNEMLSRERVEHFHAYLYVCYPELYCYPHSVAWVAEDWQGLSKLVRESTINEREEVLEIIRKVRVYDDREALLLKLNGGHAYRIMESTMFPQLRKVELQVKYQLMPRTETDSSDPLIYTTLKKDTTDLPEDHSLASVNQQVVSQSGSEALHPSSPAEPKFAIKTNMLLWAGIQSDLKHTTPVANVALEYYINSSFSVELGAMYSYWRYNSNHAFQGISGYRLEPRYRFSLPLKRKQMEIFLGPYLRFGDYDRRNAVDSWLTPNVVSQLTVDSYHAGDNATVNYTGDYWDAGLSGGVTIHLVGGLGLEVGTRVGYVKTKATMYTEENGDNWFDAYKPYSKFRVTDLNVSLIYRFR